MMIPLKLPTNIGFNHGFQVVRNGFRNHPLVDGLFFASPVGGNSPGEDINATGLADFLYTLGLAIEDSDWLGGAK